MNLKLILLSPVTAFYNFLVILPTSIDPVDQGVVVLKRQLFLIVLGLFLGLRVTVLITIGNIVYILTILKLKDELKEGYLGKVMERMFGYKSNVEEEDNEIENDSENTSHNR